MNLKPKFPALLLALLSILFIGASAQAAGVLFYLDGDDCQKCHLQQIEQVKSRGGRHKAVSCLDCHLEHPPRGSGAIPNCAICHSKRDSDHYGVENCRDCHHAHRPTEVDFAEAGRVTEACASCHPLQGSELEEYPSSHSLLDCKECHQQHGLVQKCMECHEPHVEEMDYEDCLACHRPHMPLKVTYENYLPSRLCSGCHQGQMDDLAVNTTRHKDISCVYCHKSQHKRVPQCVICHGKPHSPGFHEKFPLCSDCHGGPHDLVN